MHRLPVIVVVVALVLTLTTSAHAIGWSLVNAKIRSKFPDVKRITTADLAERLADTRRDAPVLLDVRTRAEFDVSHLKGARQVEPGSGASAVRLPKDAPIVTYCSVGYRSGAFAQKLLAAGYTNVVNLEGSIFRWANEGRPVFRNGQQVKQVHPYNATWGLLLKKKHRAHVPAAEAKS